MYGISNSAMEAILNLFSLVLPKGHCIPDTLDEKVRKVIRDLGLDYIKINACKNDCVLFWKENAELEACPVCKESRWQDLNDGADKSVEDASSDACTSKKKRLPTLLSSYP